MRYGIEAREGNPFVGEPTLTQLGDDTVIGSWTAPAADGTEREMFQVLTFRDGKIVDMQDCSSRADAERFARRRR